MVSTIAVDPHSRATRSMTRAATLGPCPSPPTSGLAINPSRPASPNAATAAAGNALLPSTSAARFATTSRAIVSTASRTWDTVCSFAMTFLHAEEPSAPPRSARPDHVGPRFRSTPVHCAHPVHHWRRCDRCQRARRPKRATLTGMRAPAAFTLVLCLASACGDDLADAPRLVLFHTNDEHSHLFGFPPEIDDYPAPTEPGDGAIHGGIVRRAALLADERAALGDDADILLVSAGDQTQGALPQIAFTTESPDFRLMAALGYDVMCPGNHEFDLGPDAYAQAIEAAGDDIPQIVSSNIHFDDEDDGDDELAALYGDGGSDARITPYHGVTTASGLRGGCFGIMGVSASFFAPLKTPVRFSADDPDDEGDREAVLPKLYDDIEPVVEALREVEEVDVVVALSHSGVDTETPELGDDYQIASHVPGIDLIVSGHSHTPLETPVVVEGPDGHEVPIVQAGSFGRWLGRVELSVPDGERPSL